MAKKDEDKNWWEEFAYMTPQEQQWVMAEHGLPYTPPTDAFETEFGVEDEFADYPLAAVGLMPEYTSKGNLDPRDLSQTNKAIDTSKDYAGMLVDNVLSMLSGGGSYDSSAFTPTKEYGNEVVLKGQNRLSDLAERGGWEGYVASKMLYEDMTASQAMAALEDFVSSVPEDDPDQPPEVRALRQSLPKARAQTGAAAIAAGLAPEGGEKGFWDTYDYDRVFNTATELQNAVYEDPAFGYSEVDPNTGQTRYYETAPEEIPTAQMEWYDKYGLPYPTASYTDPKYLQDILNREEGSTPQQRESELAGWEQMYKPVQEGTQRAESDQRQQMEMDRQMLQAWDAIQRPEPLATRPATTTVPGRAGVQYGRENVPSPNAPGARTLRPTADEMTLPTTVLQPGRQMAAPLPGLGNPATGAGAGRTWAYTNNQGQMFDTPPGGTPPQVRTLANGMMGVVGQGTTPQPGQGRGFGFLKPGVTSVPAGFDASMFKLAPEGSKTRPMTEVDISPEARNRRFDESEKRAGQARTKQRQVEARDPRLNDIEQFAKLYWLTQRGRSPLQDAIKQRRAGISQLGL